MALCAASLWSAWTPATARAKPGVALDACGNVYVEVDAECVVVPPSAQCEAMCEPVSVEAACAADLSVECRAECDELPSVSCTGSCRADCEGECRVDPGKFDCKTRCEADCGGDCDTQCARMDDRTECETSCEGSCSASCDSACDIRAPSADCEARCDASCKGSCEVDTNLDCQLECQNRSKLACTARVEGGCEAKCKAKEGVLFCNDQYIDHGGQLQECIDALKAAIAAHVTVETSGESMCDNGTCTASGRAKVKSDCAVLEPGAATRAEWHWLSGVALALGVLVNRRRRHDRRR
jgi:hypothetical protein